MLSCGNVDYGIAKRRLRTSALEYKSSIQMDLNLMGNVIMQSDVNGMYIQEIVVRSSETL